MIPSILRVAHHERLAVQSGSGPDALSMKYHGTDPASFVAAAPGSAPGPPNIASQVNSILAVPDDQARLLAFPPGCPVLCDPGAADAVGGHDAPSSGALRVGRVESVSIDLLSSDRGYRYLVRLPGSAERSRVAREDALSYAPRAPVDVNIRAHPLSSKDLSLGNDGSAEGAGGAVRERGEWMEGTVLLSYDAGLVDRDLGGSMLYSVEINRGEERPRLNGVPGSCIRYRVSSKDVIPNGRVPKAAPSETTDNGVPPSSRPMGDPTAMADFAESEPPTSLSSKATVSSRLKEDSQGENSSNSRATPTPPLRDIRDGSPGIGSPKKRVASPSSQRVGNGNSQADGGPEGRVAATSTLGKVKDYNLANGSPRSLTAAVLPPRGTSDVSRGDGGAAAALPPKVPFSGRWLPPKHGSRPDDGARPAPFVEENKLEDVIPKQKTGNDHRRQQRDRKRGSAAVEGAPSSTCVRGNELKSAHAYPSGVPGVEDIPIVISFDDRSLSPASKNAKRRRMSDVTCDAALLVSAEGSAEKRMYLPQWIWDHHKQVKGCIIGQGGCNHKRLECETGCRIAIRGRFSGCWKTKHEDPYVLIVGEDKNVRRAIRSINQLLARLVDEDSYGRLLCDLASPGEAATCESVAKHIRPIYRRSPSDARRQCWMSYVEFPDDITHPGCLLGTGGAIMKAMRKETGCGIKIYGFDQHSIMSNPYAMITGRSEKAVEDAIAMVKEKLVAFLTKNASSA